MKFFTFILALFIALFLVLSGFFMEGGHFRYVIQKTAAMGVFFGAIGFLWTAFPPRIHLKAWRAVFTKSALSERESLQCESYFDALGQGASISGVVVCLLGLIRVMENLHRPETIGPGIAVAVIPFAYGAFIKFAIANNLKCLLPKTFGPEVSEKIESKRGIPIQCLGPLIVLGGFIVTLLLEGGYLSSVTQLTSFYLIFGCIFPAAALLVILYKVKKKPDPLSDLKMRSVLTYSAVGSGTIGSLLGSIHVLENLSAPDKIGPGVAVAFVSIAYSLLAALLSLALYYNRLIAADVDTEMLQKKPKVPDMLSETAIFFGILIFIVMVILYALNMTSGSYSNW